jgi:carboxymethylenebutenolidase
MATTRTDQVTVPDGSFDLHLWVPEAGHGPGLLLLQEIYGVSAYLRAVAERLVAHGYVVAAPDVFWRIQRNWEADHTEEGLQASFGVVQQFDRALGIADCVASLHRLGELDEVQGDPGVIGFCLGGYLAYHVAAQADPAVAVCYYGSGIAGSLDLATNLECPIQFHYGEEDPYIPSEEVGAVRAALGSRADTEIHVQPGAGHAFDNHEAPMFHEPRAAAAAWALTMGFLARHLPVS